MRLVELAHRMTRKLAVNFSIVRRSADCASRESKSASLMMTTADRAQGYQSESHYTPSIDNYL